MPSPCVVVCLVLLGCSAAPAQAVTLRAGRPARGAPRASEARSTPEPTEEGYWEQLVEPAVEYGYADPAWKKPVFEKPKKAAASDKDKAKKPAAPVPAPKK